MKLENGSTSNETACPLPRDRGNSLLRFGIVGISATIIYYVLAMACAFAGLMPVVANLIGYCAGVVTSFIGHLHYTFRKREKHVRHLIRFIAVTFLGYVLSNFIIFLVMDANRGPFWLAILTVVLLIPPLNYLCGRYWTFK